MAFFRKEQKNSFPMAQVDDNTRSTVAPDQLRRDLGRTAFAFRGYNTTNLGLSPELLEQPAYRAIVAAHLDRGSAMCRAIKGRNVDLVARVRERRDTSLATYDEAVAIILAMEQAQIEILRQVFDIEIAGSQFAFGFSLGEIGALVAAGALDLESAMRISIEMSDDCVKLADNVVLGVLFSRRGELSLQSVSRVCQEINAEGKGVIGVSAYLAPNSMLLIGQNGTLDELAQRRKEISSERVYLRRNDHRWPPLHTSIMWQKCIPNRAQQLMHTANMTYSKPAPDVFSLVTGAISYDACNVREIIGRWVDHPQRLWDAVDYSLASGVEAVVHVGPQPNIIPATFDRLAANVQSQTKDSVRMRALSAAVRRPWLQSLLPRRAGLLRATQLVHVRLEEWLLANVPLTTSSSEANPTSAVITGNLANVPHGAGAGTAEGNVDPGGPADESASNTT